MNRIGRKLADEDLRAIDLLLDLGSTNAQVVTRMATAACQRRVTAASRLLSKLDALPASDPPAGLVARTMARVDAQPMAVERPAVTTLLNLH